MVAHSIENSHCGDKVGRQGIITFVPFPISVLAGPARRLF